MLTCLVLGSLLDLELVGRALLYYVFPCMVQAWGQHRRVELLLSEGYWLIILTTWGQLSS